MVGPATAHIVSPCTEQHHKNAQQLGAESWVVRPCAVACGISFPSRSAPVLPTLYHSFMPDLGQMGFGRGLPEATQVSGGSTATVPQSPATAYSKPQPFTTSGMNTMEKEMLPWAAERNHGCLHRQRIGSL